MSDELKDYSDNELKSLIAEQQVRKKIIVKQRELYIKHEIPIELEMKYLDIEKKLKKYNDELLSRKKISPGNSEQDGKSLNRMDDGTSENEGGTTNKSLSQKRKFLILIPIIILGLTVSFFLYIHFFEKKGKMAFESEYPKQLFGKMSYLEYFDKKQDPEIELEKKEYKVSLTSNGSIESVFWMKFKNNNIQWEEYDKICLIVDYDQGTHFDQSAMLKLQLNEITLTPLNGKINRSGINDEEIFIFEKRGCFLYQLKHSDLDEKNDVTITLNKGKWVNLCILLSLIKNELK